MPKHLQSLTIVALVVLLAAFSYLAVRHNEAVGRASTGVYVPPNQSTANTTVGNIQANTSVQ